jgi:hypothetical protein
MYQEVYEEIVKGGIAVKNTDKEVLNAVGESAADTDAAAFGLPTRYRMCRPDKLIFVDEVGSNTSTTKDGNVGGEKFLCHAKSRPQVELQQRTHTSRFLDSQPQLEFRSCVQSFLLPRSWMNDGCLDSTQAQHGLETTITYKAMRAGSENPFQWDQPVTSTASRFQPSAVQQKSKHHC